MQRKTIIFGFNVVDIEDIDAIKSIKNRLEESGKKEIMKRPILNILSLTCLQVYFSVLACGHLDVRPETQGYGLKRRRKDEDKRERTGCEPMS